MSKEIFEQALRIMQCVANHAAAGYEYREHWRRDFRIQEIDEFFEKIQKELDADFWNAVFALPEEQKMVLGFLKFSEHDNAMCIPVWIWACLPDDMTISGNAGGKMKKDLDNDTRFGCVWWRV
jgi:hypothetical protein